MSATDHQTPPAGQLPEGMAAIHDIDVYRVSGPGARDFLQGQLSQSLDEVNAGRAPRAAASTPKGRAYLLTRLVCDGDDILMSIPAAIAEPVVTQLRKYLMLFRGTSMTLDENWRIYGIIGSETASALCTAGQTLPDTPCDVCTTASGGHLVCTESTAEGTPRFEFWGASGLDTTLPQSVWQAAEIAAGVPSLTEATRESYVPQMLNWQHLQGIHFRKGCYTGQEVIARMHYLGQLKKSLFRMSIDAGGPEAEPGTPVYAEGRQAGEVVNAVTLSDGSQQCLAVLRHDASRGELRVNTPDGAKLTLLPLPYEVPEQTARTDT